MTVAHDFHIPRFRVDGRTYGRFLARRWGMRSLPVATVALLAVVLCAVIFDVRVAIAIVMLCGVLLPMAWLLAMDRLFRRSQSLSAPCSLTYSASTCRLTIRFYRIADDGDDDAVVVRQITLTPADYTLSYSGSHLVVDYREGPLLAPLDLVVRS